MQNTGLFASPTSAGSIDLESKILENIDVGSIDVENIDAGSIDAGSIDAESKILESIDAGSIDVENKCVAESIQKENIAVSRMIPLPQPTPQSQDIPIHH